MDAVVDVAPVELDGEQRIGRLRLPVGDHWVVIVREMRVVPMDIGAAVSPGRDCDERAPLAARSAGSRARVSWKWPRWLVANCCSYPRASRITGPAMTPALLIKMCRERCEARKRAANASIDAGSARSSRSTSTRSMPASAAVARARWRTPTSTEAPASLNARVVSSPMPECPPVMITLRPVKSMPLSTSAAVDAAV